MSETVLITGATGFIGAHILKQLLTETTFKIRVALRDIKKKQHIVEQYQGQVDGSIDVSERLTFEEIKDLTAPGALQNALHGVTYIVHVASPFAWRVKDNRKDLIEPAINLTRAVLEAARATPTVKRVVITGSFSSIIQPLRGGGIWRNYNYTEKDWNPLTNIWLTSWYGPTAYLASKTLAEKEVWNFIETEKPQFDAVVLCPPMVFGPILHQVDKAASLNESSVPIYKLIGAKCVPKDDTVWVDVRDVAKAHVEAITNSKASNQRYLVSGGAVSWQAVCDEAREQHPEWAIDLLPKGNVGHDITHRIATLDTAKARNDLGITFRTWQETIVQDTLPQLYEMRKSWLKRGVA